MSQGYALTSRHAYSGGWNNSPSPLILTQTKQRRLPFPLSPFRQQISHLPRVAFLCGRLIDEAGGSGFNSRDPYGV